MKIVTRQVSQLREDPENARQHGKRSLDAISASLLEFGQEKPIVISDDGTVRLGNGVLLAARALGWETLECVITKHKGAKLKALAIIDNRAGELSEWQDEELRRTLAQLEREDPALMAVVGFDSEALRKTMEISNVPDLENFDVKPSAKRAWIILNGTPDAIAELAEKLGSIMGKEMSDVRMVQSNG